MCDSIEFNSCAKKMNSDGEMYCMKVSDDIVRQSLEAAEEESGLAKCETIYKC